MMKVKLIFAFFTVLIISGTVFSQDRVLYRPAKYVKPIDETDLKVSSERASSYWRVYSDRSDNVTYNSPEDTTNSNFNKRLYFLDVFYVIDERDEYIRILKDPNFDSRNNRLSGQKINYGWIHKSKVILWDHCLVTENQVSRKTMVVNTIEHLGDPTQEDPDYLYFRNRPSSDNYERTGRSSHLFEFYFVMKTEKVENTIWVLVADKESFILDNVEDVIWGWAPQSRLTPWDNRVAIEPNWDPDAVIERRKTNKIARLFTDDAAAKKYQQGVIPNENKILWENDLLGDRPLGYLRRFPILTRGKKDDEIIQVGALGDIVAGKDILDPVRVARLQKLITETEKKAGTVNVIFVIDGTQSMGRYYAAVVEGVKQSVDVIREIRSDCQYNFGAVVYRDYTEGDKAVEIHQLNGISNIVTRWLLNIEAKDVNNFTTYESMFNGLEKALDKNIMAGSQSNIFPQQNNVVILIGDAGNHPDDTKRKNVDGIVERLVDMNCHFVAFQVHRGVHGAYQDFIDQSIEIMEKNINAHLDKFRGNIRDLSLGDLTINPTLETRGNFYESKNGLFISKVYGISRGSTLSPNELKESIKSFILDMNERTTRLLNELRRIELGYGEEGIIDTESDPSTSNVFVRAAIVELLIRNGFNQSQIELAFDRKFQLYTRSSSTFIIQGQQYPLFRRVVLMTHSELSRLRTDINYILGAADEVEQIANAWKTILKRYVGNISDEEMRKYTLKDLHGMVTDIPSQSIALDFSIADIYDPIFTRERKTEYINYLRKKEVELEKIFNEGEHYSCSFRSNNILYFWIPVEIMP